LYNRLYNRLYNQENVCIHDTAGCTTGCTAGCTTGCIVYTQLNITYGLLFPGSAQDQYARSTSTGLYVSLRYRHCEL